LRIEPVNSLAVTCVKLTTSPQWVTPSLKLSRLILIDRHQLSILLSQIRTELENRLTTGSND